MNVEAFITMAGVVNRGVEAFKKNVLDRFLPSLSLETGSSAVDVKDRESVRAGVLVVASALLGILIVVGAGPEFNIVTGSTVYGQANPLFGQIITGIFVGGGANAINWGASFFWGWKASPPSGSLAAMVSTTPGSVEIETHSVQ